MTRGLTRPGGSIACAVRAGGGARALPPLPPARETAAALETAAPARGPDNRRESEATAPTDREPRSES